MIMKTMDKFIIALGLIGAVAGIIFVMVYVADVWSMDCTNEAWRWYDSVEQYEKETWCDFSATGLIDNK